MKTFIKLAAVIALSSGLAACSSSKKEDSSILDDMAKVENSENSESSILSDIEDTSADQQKESTSQSNLLDESSLGTGSSGLGH